VRRLSAELKSTLTEQLSMQHEDDEARAIRNWEAIATVIEELGRQAPPAGRQTGEPTPRSSATRAWRDARQQIGASVV
jgi:hypothetical protein